MDTPDIFSESVQRQFDWSDTAPSIAVINSLACLEDSEPSALPEELNGPLFDYIDPEALDTLVVPDCPTTITFLIEDYKIQIDGTSLIIWYD